MLRNVWIIVIAFWEFSYQFNWSLVWKVVCYFVSSFGPMRDRGAKERSQKRERNSRRHGKGESLENREIPFYSPFLPQRKTRRKETPFWPTKEREREGHHLSKREREPLSEQSERLEQSPCWLHFERLWPLSNRGLPPVPHAHIQEGPSLVCASALNPVECKDWEEPLPPPFPSSR